MVYFISYFYFIFIFSWNKNFTKCLKYMNNSIISYETLFNIKILQNVINFFYSMIYKTRTEDLRDCDLTKMNQSLLPQISS